jgi:transposase
LLLNRKEKEALVIKHAKEGKTYREMAKIVHISPVEIKKILDKITGDENSPQSNREKGKQKSQYAQAFQMFKDKKILADVAIELDIKSNVVMDFYNDYLQLVRMERLIKIYNELKNDFPLFLHLFRRIKKEGLNKQDITELLQNHNKLIDLNAQVDFYNNHISEQELKIQQLAQTINRLQQQE